jgi:hypothetical protein
MTPFSLRTCRVGAATRHVGATTRHVGGATWHVGATTWHVGGTTRRVGGTTRHVGGTTRHVGGATRHVGGTAGRPLTVRPPPKQRRRLRPHRTRVPAEAGATRETDVASLSSNTQERSGAVHVLARSDRHIPRVAPASAGPGCCERVRPRFLSRVLVASE